MQHVMFTKHLTGYSLDEIIAGASGGNRFERIEDRRAAIRRAVELAGSGDVVVIAGKGHEPYQEIGTTKYPYDDRTEARRALEAWLAGRENGRQ